MKRFLCLLLALLLLTGCTPSTPESSAVSEPSFEGSTLTLYSFGGYFCDTVLPLAIAAYKQEHPGAKVDLKTFAYSEYAEILTVDLLAGRGPDVVLLDSYTLPDIRKTVDAGVFRELGALFDADPTFDPVDYGSMLDCGRFGGGLWYVSLAYTTYNLLTGDALLERFGFPGDICDFASFARALTDCANRDEQTARALFPDRGWALGNLLLPSGLRLVDYDAMEALPDPALLEVVTELHKAVYPYIQFEDAGGVYSAGDYAQAAADGAALFHILTGETMEEYAAASAMLDAGVRVVPFPCADGRPVAYPSLIAAIRAGADADAAYVFLKTLLSAPIQTKLTGTPLNSAAVRERIEAVNRMSNSSLDSAGQDALFELLTDVIPSRDYSHRLLLMYIRAMTPYWEGNADYDTCVSELRNTLELYLYE